MSSSYYLVLNGGSQLREGHLVTQLDPHWEVLFVYSRVQVEGFAFRDFYKSPVGKVGMGIGRDRGSLFCGVLCFLISCSRLCRLFSGA